MIKSRTYKSIFRLLCLMLCCLLTFTGFAQDPVYSQFYAAPLQLNPAFAGNVEGGYVSMNYRNQWPSISKAYRTFSVSASKFYRSINSGLGLSILADDAGNGLYKTMQIEFMYAYRLKIREGHYLRSAIQAGYGRTQVNWDGLVFYDQIDPEFGAISPGGTPFPTSEVRPDKTSSSYIDVGAGILYYNPSFYAGLAVHHLNTPNDDFLASSSGVGSVDVSGLPIRWTIHGGGQIDLGRTGRKDVQTYVAPHFLFVKQKDFTQVDLGAHIVYNQIGLGLSYRHAGRNPDALIPSFFVQAGAYKIGYSYDITISELAIPSGGAHEISVNINFEKFPWYKEESKYNDCLNLFR